MTRTTDELKFATRVVLERHRIPSWQPTPPAAAAPIARRLAAREPAPVAAEEPQRPAWMARMRAKELVR